MMGNPRRTSSFEAGMYSNLKDEVSKKLEKVVVKQPVRDLRCICILSFEHLALEHMLGLDIALDLCCVAPIVLFNEERNFKIWRIVSSLTPGAN